MTSWAPRCVVTAPKDRGSSSESNAWRVESAKKSAQSVHRVFDVQREEVRVAGGPPGSACCQEDTALEDEHLSVVVDGKPAQETLQRVEHGHLLDPAARGARQRLQGEVLFASGAPRRCAARPTAAHRLRPVNTAWVRAKVGMIASSVSLHATIPAPEISACTSPARPTS